MSVGVEVKAQIKLPDGAAKFEKALENFVSNALLYGVAQAKRNSPVKTGHLRRSIHLVKENRFAGKYGTAIIYARIQEFGGTIRPKRAKYLRFKVGNQWVTAKQVTIRGKHYMKRSADAVAHKAPALARKAVRDVGL